jgi:cytochrome c oxidase subunit 2
MGMRTWSRIVVGAVLAAVVGSQTPLGAERAGQAERAQRRVVRIKAERFAFTPSEIAMTAGEEIEIRLKSDDTGHGFRLVGKDVDITIPKRGQGEAVVVFKGERAGKYEFECSHLCGAGHSFMRGVIVVKDAKR